MKPLTPAQRRELRARAHALHPFVMIGNEGLTSAVLHEIDATLKSRDLIKIRVAGDDRDAREALLHEICRRVGASPVQHIGKILVVYREAPPAAPAAEANRPARPGVRRTKATPAQRSAPRSAPRPATRTSRR